MYWYAGKGQNDTEEQHPLGDDEWVRDGSNLQDGAYNYVIMPDRSVRAFPIESTWAAYANVEHWPGHTSLTGKAPVIMAGDFKVVNGQIVKIGSYSGHYRPGSDWMTPKIDEHNPVLKEITWDAFAQHGFSLDGAQWIGPQIAGDY